MKTRARRNREHQSEPVQLREIEDRAFLETRQADYDAPDDVLGPLYRKKIAAQAPKGERDGFLEFWAETLKAEPDQERETSQIVKRAIKREQQRERRKRVKGSAA